MQRDVAAAVKSTRPAHLRENINVFDFQLSDNEMDAITGLDCQHSVAGFTHQDPQMLELLLTLE